MLNGTVGRMRDSSPHHFCNFVHCVQTGVWTGAVQKEDLIHTVWPKPSNSFFNFFNVCTYRSAELIVAPLSTNPTNEIPSLFQKTLSMVLPHISPHIDFFFLHGDDS